MCKFKTALAHTLKFEGGFSNDYNDPGGPTNYGVSLRFLRSLGDMERHDYDGDGDIDLDDILLMPKRDAAALYKAEFWNERYQELPTPLATKIFDFSVNMGNRQAIKLLQRQCFGLKIDGIYGPLTHAEVSQKPPVWLMKSYIAAAAEFYYTISENKPQLRKYLFGWLRRAYSRT